jgi:hypothetical protein
LKKNEIGLNGKIFGLFFLKSVFEKSWKIFENILLSKVFS